MIVNRVGVLSVGKIASVLYGILGLFIGGFVSLITMGGTSLAGPGFGPFGVLFGVGAIILFPLMYGAVGLIGGVLAAALYNLLAGIMGGIELEVSQGPGPEGHP